jgi:hypothetical protein
VKPGRQAGLAVFRTLHDPACAEGAAELGRGGLVRLDGERVLCRRCVLGAEALTCA